MKNSRKAFAASVLALALSASALAGEMHTDSPTPPPTANSTTQAAATDGEMHTDLVADVVTEAALELLPTLLTLI